MISAEGNRAGSRGNVSCYSQYVRRGSEYYTCSLSGTWTGSSRCSKFGDRIHLQWTQRNIIEY